MRLITLTTDFGTQDWFVGTMKGVIAGIALESRVIDITHDVSPGDIRAGAFALMAAAPYFPAGAVHVAVVDPGVGSARRAIALRTKDAIFIGPDNGVLSWAVRNARVEEIRQLGNVPWRLQPVSHTFHGRDVFAPAAARLAAGAALADAGEPLSDFMRLPWPKVQRGDRSLVGEVLYVDRFGNAITNLSAEALSRAVVGKSTVRLHIGGTALPVHDFYAAVDVGEPVAVVGSSGLIELSVNGCSFAEDFGATVGAAVEATW